MKTYITFITSNLSKVEQVSKYLGIPINHAKIDLVEIQSLDLNEVIEHKLREAYSKVQAPIMVDDAAVTITALGKLPGPFIKFFLSELGAEGICKLMKSFDDKQMKGEVGIGVYDGENMEIFIGSIDGTIIDAPKGTGGFGWDCIVVPNGYSQTRAEMNETDYDATSPRKFALEKLEKYLKAK